MKASDIQQELTALCERHTVVVWHDPAGEFADAARELNLPGVTVLIEGDLADMELKRLFNAQDGSCRYLLYRPHAQAIRNDWLADVESAAATFSADFTSALLRRLSAQDTAEMRACVEKHRAFLAKRGSITKLANLQTAYDRPHALELGIIAVSMIAAGCKLARTSGDRLSPSDIARAYIESQLDGRTSDLTDALTTNGVLDTARNALRIWTGFTGDFEQGDAFLHHVILCAFCKTCGVVVSFDFMPSCSSAQLRFCYDVISECARGNLRNKLFTACRDVEQDCNAPSKLEGLDLSSLLPLDVLPCVDECILEQLFRSAAIGNDHPEELLAALASRSSSMWHGLFTNLFQGAEAALTMRLFHRNHPDGIPALDAAHLWGQYQDEYSLMDRWYRKLMASSLRQTLGSNGHEVEESFRACCDSMEGLYKEWFLKGLSRRWGNAIEGDLARQGYVASIPRQRDFFMAQVEGFGKNRKRVAVIISDALRFEVARDVAERLERTTKGTCELKAMQAELPSITPCGMSALLPARSYELVARKGEAGFQVLVNGKERRSTALRQEALRSQSDGAIAIQYRELIDDMSRTDRRELMADAKLVYIYHNAIDAIGDNATTERKVATACEDAVDELASLVSLLTRESLTSQIIITADHGFLYTGKPLANFDRLGTQEIHGAVFEQGRRYAICDDAATSDVLMRVSLPSSTCDNGHGLVCLAPRECTRLKKAGGGENYVHGGVSLQEMCVPVLKYTSMRAGSKNYEAIRTVDLALVSTIEAVTNPEFTVELLQTEPVGGKVAADSFELYVRDSSGRPVSSIVRIVADRTDPDASRRTIKATLGIRSDVTTSEQDQYQLVYRSDNTDEEKPLTALRILLISPESDPWSW